MLTIENTKKLTGVTISGTHDDLYELYHAIENVLGPEDQGDLTSLRILAVCYDLRHCFMGDRDIEFVDNGYDEELQKYFGEKHPGTNVHFSVDILWLDVMFAALALDDAIKRYANDRTFNLMMKNAGMEEDQKQYYFMTRYEDIALVRLFQEKVWKAFRDATGEAAFKRLYKKAKETECYNSSFRYSGFCAHYIDELQMKYLYAEPEKRKKLLATLVRKMIVLGEDYYQLHHEVSSYALENGVDPSQVRLKGVDYPEHLEW
ncbi:DUF6904 family protein [Proteiniclasticum sp. C24MP]|uniref:DUF6904 family protein n=1 Tax=Proteiniclasticum sp. C24MP TaxID=3374101 RepID=UPI00375435FC